MRYFHLKRKRMFVPYGNDKQLENVVYPFAWLLKRAKYLPIMIPKTYLPYALQDGEKVLSNEKQGFYFGITATENDLKNATKAELELLFENAMKVKRLCGIDDVRFSGILEGLFFKNGFREAGIGSKATVRMVKTAIDKVRGLHNMPETIHVLVVGAGFIGGELVDELRCKNIKDIVHVFDVHNQDMFPVIAQSLAKKSVIVVDCSGPQVLEKYYAKHFQPGFILVNEVYGSLKSLEMFANLGVSVYHIAGTAGETNPPNKPPYGKAIPGCASWSDFIDVELEKIA